MKLVLAIIKPHKLDEVREALGAIDVQGVTVSEARGYGRQKGQLELYAGSEYEWTFLPKARVEIYCDEAAAAAVDKALIENSRTGRIGDGKILVQTVEQVESVD